MVMARYDKYDNISGGFRAPLGANLVLAANGEFGPAGISLDANGRVLVGGPNNTGLVGVLVKNMPAGAILGNAQLPPITAAAMGSLAGDIVDVMTDGEIVDIPGLTAGTVYYAAGDTGALIAGDAGGALPAGSPAGSIRVGHTVEANRLIVRVEH